MVSADTLNRRGVNLKRDGNDEGAKFHYLAALACDGEFVPALANVAEVLGAENKLHAALACFRRVVALAPFDGNQLMNLGTLLMRMEQFPEAEEVLNRVATMMPDVPQVWHNLALLHHRKGDFQQAITLMRQVQLLGKTGPEVDNDLCHMLLAEGRSLQRALEVYETRWWTIDHLPPWDYHVPEWQGEKLEGKRILVHHEQGFGDTIMCARFVRDLVERHACEVVFCVPEALRVWLAHQDWFGVCVISMEQLSAQDVAGVDFHSPLYSAMRWMGLEWEDIRPGPTLVPPRVECQGVDRRFFNVGVCWASGRRHTEVDWRHRHAPLHLWLPLAANPRVKLWSLCKGEEWEEEIAALGAEALITDHTREFRDWADTAALLAELDLVISVDTAVVHASAALGRPTWMVNQFSRCWRWQESPSGRPWYNCMRIYNQTTPGDWMGALARCKEDLDEITGGPVAPRWLGYTPAPHLEARVDV